MSNPEYGMDKIPSKQFRRIAREYAQGIIHLRRTKAYPDEPAEGMSDSEYQSLIDEMIIQRDAKIERHKDKLRAMVKEILRRVNLPNLPLTVLPGNRVTFPRIMARCPICQKTINFVNTIVFESGKLGLRCTACGAERWET